HKNSGIPKHPKPTTDILIPSQNLAKLQGHLFTPVTESLPILEIINPINVAIKGFSGAFCVKPHAAIKVNKRSEKYSAGPNNNANFAKIVVNNTNTINPSIPPQKEEIAL